jgi:hypothetical protein
VDQVLVGAGGTSLFALFAEATAAISDLIRKFAGVLDFDGRPSFQAGRFG